MIRRVSFIKRKAGLSDDEFFHRWMGRHAELLNQLPGIRGLRFTRIERCTPEAPGWDGLGESWFDSLEDFDRAFATEPLRSALFADREGCIGDSQTCYVEEPEGFTLPAGTSK